MNVKHIGLFFNSFLMDISRAIENLPLNQTSGFILQFKFFDSDLDFYCKSKMGTYAKPSRVISNNKMDLELWVPNIDEISIFENRINIYGNFLYISPQYDDGTKKDIISLCSDDIKCFKIKYDEYLAEYNMECISNEQQKRCQVEEYNT